MSEDYDGDYAGIALQVVEMDDVRIYLERQQKILHKTQIENQSLMDENTRLHARNKELHEYLGEQRERLTPDKDLVSKKVLTMAVDLLEIGDVVYEYEADDFRYKIVRIKRRTHEEKV